MNPVQLTTSPGQVKNLQQRLFSPNDVDTTFHWAPPVPSIGKYHVRWWIDGGNSLIVPSSIPSYTLRDLEPGRHYNLQVACILCVNGDEHCGIWSDVKTFETAPAPPRGLIVSPALQSPSTSFFVKCVDEDTIGKTYTVKVANILTGKDRLKTTENLVTLIDDLSPGTPYSVSVTSTKNGLASKPWILEREQHTVPDRAMDLLGQRSSGTSQTISWKKVFGAKSYNVKWKKKDGNFQTLSTKETQITLSRLASGQKYEVCVAAENSSGIGEYSDPIKLSTDLAPPLNLTTVMKYSNEKAWAEVHFMAPEDQETRQYIVKLTPDGFSGDEDDETPATVQRVFTTRAVFTPLDHGTCYVPSVAAIGEKGKESRKIYGVPVWTRPGSVEGLRSTAVSGNVEEVKWEEVDGSFSYIISTQKEGEDPMPEIETTKTQITLNNLSLNTTYAISVAAKNDGGVGRFSAPVKFQTAVAAPTDIILQNHPDNPEHGIIATWQECDGATQYAANLIDDTTTKKLIPCVQKGCRKEFQGEKVEAGHQYKVALQSIASDIKRNSEIVLSQSIWTYCSQVQGLEVKPVSSSAVEITWHRVKGAENYRIIGKAKSGKIIREESQTHQLTLTNLDLGETYTLTVAPWNKAGYGRESDSKTFSTELQPPKGVHITNDKVHPTTDLNVRLEEPEIPPSSYQVRIMRLNGEPDEFVTMTRQEAMSVKRICGLTPGDSYQLAISSLHDEDKRLNSKEIFSKVIQTKTPPLSFELLKASNNTLKVTWRAIIGATAYTIYYRTQFGEWVPKQFHSDENETILKDLESGEKYEVKVTATNKSGQGQESQIKQFTTGPSTPTELKSEPLSTREMKFSCQRSHGAMEYIFEINGEKHRRQEPLIFFPHPETVKDFSFKVSASNEGGCSNPSAIAHCSQTLLKLQKKFLKKAKNYNSQFITPELSEVPSGNPVNDYGMESFSVGVGNTVCLQGTRFSGKTSCVFHYLQNLGEDLLPIFLDWDDYKDPKGKKTDIKSVLAQQMKDFEEYERDFAFQWMKSHPDKVVFVVDDLVLPQNVARKMKLYDDVASMEEIFYSLVTTDREIFTQSQVLCSTSQNNLRQLIRPNQTLKIDGFGTEQINRMKEMVLGEEKDLMLPKHSTSNQTLNIDGFDAAQINRMKQMALGGEKDVMLPKHLEYFCRNPTFCKLILQLVRNHEPSVDMQSYSSVMIKLITEGVSRYPAGKRDEKLSSLLGEIKKVPQKLKTVKIDPSKLPKKPKSTSSAGRKSQISDVPTFSEFPAHAPAKYCCETLDDYMTKALYFGLICSLEEFKKRFHKKSVKLGANANIWILSVGILREHTRNLVADLFGPIDYKPNMGEMEKKLKFTRSFVKENRDLIHRQTYSDSQISLDWLDIINEIEGLNIIPNLDWKVSVKNTHKQEEIYQMVNFLSKVRGIFFNHIRVKLEKDLSLEKRLDIESAMKRNPDGEIGAKSSGSASKRGALNLSFHSRGMPPSLKQDLHSTSNSMEDEGNDGVFAEHSFTPSDNQSLHSQEEVQPPDDKGDE